MGKINFTNKHILISGGSSGIGLSLAKDFFKRGAHVTILARRANLLAEAKKEIELESSNTQQELKLISADITDFQALTKALRPARRTVDVLINSAGTAYPGEFEKLAPTVFSNVMDVNYLGTVHLTKLITPEMVNKKSGYIVNISSLAAVIGIYGYTAYAPSKYAIRGFSRCLRAELGAKGIHVSVVLPPDTDTPQLAFEHALLPEITRKINQNGGVLSPETVSSAIINGMRKKRFTIIPGLEGKILYLFAPIIGRYFYHFAIHQQK